MNIVTENTRKLILLDLGNVLLDYRPERFAERVARVAAGKSPEEILELYARGPMKAAFERGKQSEADFFAEMVDWLGLRVDATPFLIDAWSDVFSITPGADHAVEKLKETDTLWLLSDTNITHHQFALRRFPFLGQFERSFVSYQTGYLKSEPEAFLPIIAAAGCVPGHIIFYDDLEPNVAMAKSVGIDAHVFKSWKGLLQSLKDRGVLA